MVDRLTIADAGNFPDVESTDRIPATRAPHTSAEDAGYLTRAQIVAGSQPLDEDLTAAAGLSTTGPVRRDGSGAWSTMGETGTGDVVLADGGDVSDTVVTGAGGTKTTAQWIDIPIPILTEQADAAGNTAALQAMITAGEDFGLEPNTYEIDDTLTVSGNSLSIEGATLLRGVTSDIDNVQSRIIHTADDSHIFNVTAANCTINHVELRTTGNGSEPLLKFERATLNANIDARLGDVILYSPAGTADQNIYINGRGFVVDHAIIAGVQRWTFDLDWSGITDDGSEYNQGLTGGFRGFRFKFLHLHGAGARGIRNAGANKHRMNGLHATAIYGDIGGEAFLGALNMSTLADVLINHSIGIPLQLQGGPSDSPVRGGRANFNINGNDTVLTKCPYNAISATAGYYGAHRVHGVATYVQADAISIAGDAAATTILEDWDIEANTSHVGVNDGSGGGDFQWLKASNATIRRGRFRGSFGMSPYNASTSVVTLTAFILKDTEFDVLWDSAQITEFLDGASTWEDQGGNEMPYVGSKSTHNELDNGEFQIAQRGAGPFTGGSAILNDDAAFLLDRWRLLSDGNDIVDVTQTVAGVSVVPTGFRHGAAFLVATADKKFGMVQMLSAAKTAQLRGRPLAFQLLARNGGTTPTLDKIRVALIEWTGTADSPTADPISAWEAEGTNPTLAANFAYVGTPGTLAELTTSFQTFRLHGTPSTSANNIGFFFWVDNDDAQVGDLLYVSGCQLERGHCCTPFKAISRVEDFDNCRYYFERIGLNSGDYLGAAYCYSTTQALVEVKTAPKRIAPTVTTSAAANFTMLHSGTTTTALSTLASAITIIGPGFDRFELTATVASGFTAGGSGKLRANTAGQYIDVSAEL